MIKLVKSHDDRKEKLDLSLLAREMVGRPVDLFYKKEKTEIGEVVLEVVDLKLTESSKPINFNLHKSEILGIAGMVGAGRTEIARAIFGADKKTGGKLIYKGKVVNPSSPDDAIKIGIGLITEERQKSGLVLNLDIIRNITLVGLDKFGRFVIKPNREVKAVQDLVSELDIKTPSLKQEVQFLSGGNQQKVVLAKWLYKDIDVMIFDEPTKGIDVNSKSEIYKLMSELVKNGKSIIMISSDMVELIAMSDRVIVIKNREVSSVLEGENITEEKIIGNAIEVPTK